MFIKLSRIVLVPVILAALAVLVIPAIAAENATITGDGVRVRDYPCVSEDCRITNSLAKGTRVGVRCESNFLSTIDGYTAPWYEISYSEGTGYVFGRYVTIDPGAKVNVDYPSGNADWSNRLARFVRDNLASFGTRQSEIVKRLGKPISSKEISGVEAGLSVTNHRLTYDGITFDIYGPNDEDRGPFSLTCTTDAYDFGGLKVGSSAADVKRLLGEPSEVKGDTLWYETILSAAMGASFRIQNGMVTRIELWKISYD